MPVIAHAPYFGTSGKLEVATDDFTAAVTSCALTPSAPSTVLTDIGGGVNALVGANAWVAAIGYRQDWTTTGSLSKQLIAWHGTKKTFKYTPVTGTTVTFDALVVAGAIGGGNNAVHEATVSLMVIGQPTFGTA